MTSKFGWCAGPTGSIGDHDTCPVELGTSGVIVRCGCPCHDSQKDA